MKSSAVLQTDKEIDSTSLPEPMPPLSVEPTSETGSDVPPPSVAPAAITSSDTPPPAFSDIVPHPSDFNFRNSAYALPKRPPPKTFLDLPRELRDEIYKLAVVSSRPFLFNAVRLPKPSLSHCKGLLSASCTVGREAAYAFYRYNTFAFDGQYAWHELYMFLITIGDLNRSYISNIRIEARKRIVGAVPEKHVYICETDLLFKQVRNVIPFGNTVKFFAQLHGPKRMDFLDPVIVDCFKLFPTASRSLKITMKLNFLIPGMKCHPDAVFGVIKQRCGFQGRVTKEIEEAFHNPPTGQAYIQLRKEFEEGEPFTNALPRLLEFLQEKYFGQSGRPEIIWEACAPRRFWIESERAFNAAGWKILDQPKGENLHLKWSSESVIQAPLQSP